MDTIIQSVSRPSHRGKYRQHPIAFKRLVVEQSLQPGASVARLAREHGINANQVFSWRKLFQEGRLAVDEASPLALLPVGVVEDAAVPAAPTAPASTHGTISLEVGRARLRIEGIVDAGTLSLVLDRVLR
jgi:transposase